MLYLCLAIIRSIPGILTLIRNAFFTRYAVIKCPSMYRNGITTWPNLWGYLGDGMIASIMWSPKKTNPSTLPEKKDKIVSFPIWKNRNRPLPNISPRNETIPFIVTRALDERCESFTYRALTESNLRQLFQSVTPPKLLLMLAVWFIWKQPCPWFIFWPHHLVRYMGTTRIPVAPSTRIK